MNTATSRPTYRRPHFLLLLDNTFDCEPADLEGLAGAEHFGFPAGFVYGLSVQGWPLEMPWPTLGPFGCLPIGDA